MLPPCAARDERQPRQDPCFFSQVQLSAGLPQPTHTPFLISIPHFLQGQHPHVWHMASSSPSRAAANEATPSDDTFGVHSKWTPGTPKGFRGRPPRRQANESMILFNAGLGRIARETFSGSG